MSPQAPPSGRLGEHPSPFASGPSADDADAASGAAALAWQDAFEEATEVPVIATMCSGVLSSTARSRYSLEEAVTQELKAADVAHGWAVWRAEAKRLVAFSIPISVRPAWLGSACCRVVRRLRWAAAWQACGA